MSLYLAIFDCNDEEIEGVEAGTYNDFQYFRETISAELENGNCGSLYPTLQNHADSDGEWSVKEAKILKAELFDIKNKLSKKPPQSLPAGWKQKIYDTNKVTINSLNDCFFDVDGEPLLDRLIGLCGASIETKNPIIFQ